MQRFYVEHALGGTEADLPEHVARQVTSVLRMKAGDRLALFDGSGPEWVGELIHGGKSARVRLVERRDPAPLPRRAVTLCQALLKGERMEWVLQKGTELGISVFQPLLTERVVAQKEEVPARWRRIVIEAAEQCGRSSLPALHAPVRLREALQTEKNKALCWEGERGRTLWSYMSEEAPGSVSLFIGPEGGFGDREVTEARAAGAISVSLGQQILRAETAALAASALVLLAP